MKTASRFFSVLTVMSLMLFVVAGAMAEDNATDEILNAQTAQVFAKDGDLTIAQTLKYLDERREFYDRWVGTFAHFRTAPLSIYWGVQEPVAVIAMANRIKLWSPTTDLYKIQESGHWPSIEVRDIIADAILCRLPLYR